MPLSPFPQGLSTYGVPVLPGAGTPPITGSVFWVDSGDPLASDTASNGTFEKPFAKIDYAVGRCTANNNDYIYVKAGHNEAVIAAGGLDLDVAGITIVFLGEGADKAKVTFGTDVGADMDIDAASITLVNPKFVAGLDALTGPIDVNAADFRIINGEYHDATAIFTTDCIVADSNAIRLKIHGWKYYEGTAGTEKESNIQLNGVDNAELIDIDIFGAFNAGNIECLTDEWLNMRMKNVTLVNTDTDPSPCIVGDANMTGVAENVKCRVASGTTYVSNVGKMSWGADCEGFSTDGYGGEPLGTAVATGLEGQVATIAATLGAVDTAAAAGAVTDTDLAMAYLKQLVTELQVVDGYFDVPTADAATDTTLRDVVGRKTDATIQAVGVDKSIMAYAKGAINALVGTPGVATWPGSVKYGNGVSMAEALAYVSDKTVNTTGTALLAAGLTGTATQFTVSGGPVLVRHLGFLVTTDIPAGANTLKFQFDVDGAGAAADLSGATDTASAAANQLFVVDGVKATGLVKVTDPGIMVAANETGMPIVLSPGVIQTVFSAGPPATGAGTCFIQWEPLTPLATVS